MARIDFKSQRLFLDGKLGIGTVVGLPRDQANYLANVLRLRQGDQVLVFNGTDGEWWAEITEANRKNVALVVREQSRPQPAPTDLHYVFSPLKQARLEYMAQKAVEMGASHLQPVLTQHTQVRSLKIERMRAHIREAAEQCGILNLPTIANPLTLEKYLQQAGDERHILFCDEGEAGRSPIPILAKLNNEPYSVLVGPEGGYSQKEREILQALPHVTPLSLGPRILRADTAAVAALAIVQAVLGDWNQDGFDK